MILRSQCHVLSGLIDTGLMIEISEILISFPKF
jgi:hypothetical protein